MSIITRINKAEKRIVDLYNKLKNLPSGASGDFVPLTGTEEGSPVTGDIELDAVNGSKKIIGAYGSTIEYADDGRILINNSISGGSNVVIGVGNFDFNEVLVSENDISEIDPTNKLIYAQRSYVDARGSVFNATTSVLSASDLNTTYPNAKDGFSVIAPNVVGGGKYYIKAGAGWVYQQILAVV